MEGFEVTLGYYKDVKSDVYIDVLKANGEYLVRRMEGGVVINSFTYKHEYQAKHHFTNLVCYEVEEL